MDPARLRELAESNWRTLCMSALPDDEDTQDQIMDNADDISQALVEAALEIEGLRVQVAALVPAILDVLRWYEWALFDYAHTAGSNEIAARKAADRLRSLVGSEKV